MTLPVRATLWSSKNTPFSMQMGSNALVNSSMRCVRSNLWGYGFFPSSLIFCTNYFLLFVYWVGSRISSGAFAFPDPAGGCYLAFSSSFFFLASSFSLSFFLVFNSLKSQLVHPFSWNYNSFLNEFPTYFFETISPVTSSRYSFFSSCWAAVLASSYLVDSILFSAQCVSLILMLT